MEPSHGLHINFILLYFVYGLAFFSMGLSMALEAGRSPLLAEARILRPLAVFGILHGLHEWQEIFMLQMEWKEVDLPPDLATIRIALLAISFTSLIAFGIQVLRPPKKLAALDAVIGTAIMVCYVGILTFTGNTPFARPGAWVGCADSLARYFIAVPAGILAAFALNYQAKQCRREDQALIASFQLAAVGFGIYGLTHFFVSHCPMEKLSFLTAQSFRDFIGMPIQAVRTVMAVLAAIGLIRATQIVEKRRQQEFIDAQQARLDALEQLQRELLKRQEMRRELLRHTVMAQEDERSRIARELHDETSQVLTAASLNMETLKKLLPDNLKAHEFINRSLDLCREMARGLYRLVHDLRPAQLDDLGLVPALRYLADATKRHTGIPVSLELTGGTQRIDPVIETVLFRITQEALTNIAKHAETDRAIVRLDIQPDRVTLQIEDQGIGMPPERLHRLGHGWGVAGMRERAESVGGEISIESSPGKGTKIEVRISVPQSTATITDAHDYGKNHPDACR